MLVEYIKVIELGCPFVFYAGIANLESFFPYFCCCSKMSQLLVNACMIRPGKLVGCVLQNHTGIHAITGNSDA